MQTLTDWFIVKTYEQNQLLTQPDRSNCVDNPLDSCWWAMVSKAPNKSRTTTPVGLFWAKLSLTPSDICLIYICYDNFTQRMLIYLTSLLWYYLFINVCNFRYIILRKARLNNNENNILTLCEAEVYGECFILFT